MTTIFRRTRRQKRAEAHERYLDAVDDYLTTAIPIETRVIAPSYEPFSTQAEASERIVAARAAQWGLGEDGLELQRQLREHPSMMKALVDFNERDGTLTAEQADEYRSRLFAGDGIPPGEVARPGGLLDYSSYRTGLPLGDVEITETRP